MGMKEGILQCLLTVECWQKKETNESEREIGNKQSWMIIENLHTCIHLIAMHNILNYTNTLPHNARVAICVDSNSYGTSTVGSVVSNQ